jgi:hypothetical protein
MFLFFLDIKLLYKFKYRGVTIVGVLFQYSSGMNIGTRLTWIPIDIMEIIK